MILFDALQFVAGCILFGAGLMFIAVSVCASLFIVESYRKSAKQRGQR